MHEDNVICIRDRDSSHEGRRSRVRSSTVLFHDPELGCRRKGGVWRPGVERRTSEKQVFGVRLVGGKMY